MPALAIYSPFQLDSNDPPALEQLGWRFLAEGDSWFTIGSLNPAKNSNLLFELSFGQSAGAVNCAFPGDTLRRMSQMNRDKQFANLLAGKKARNWDAVLLSCGGNDLIDAIGVRGDGLKPAQRLLLAPAEWGPESDGPMRYVSADGWLAFARYFQANLEQLLARRLGGPSEGCPVFMHGYAYPTPRPAGAAHGMGPWIYPSVQAYGIPEVEQPALAQLLLRRLGDLLAACAADGSRFPNLHFFDTARIPIDAAAPGSTGVSGDWVNEIHLTWRGYDKLAAPWAAHIEAALAAR